MTKTETRDQAVAVLEAAAARIRDKGWRRWDMGHRDGPNCVGGAIYWAAADLRLFNPDTEEIAAAYGRDVMDVARLAVNDRIGQVPITVWNDETCPSQEAAADILAHAAKDLANE